MDQTDKWGPVFGADGFDDPAAVRSPSTAKQYPPPPPASGPTAGPNVPYGAPQGFGPPPGYGPPQGYDPRFTRAAQLAESARNWLIICAIGWFVGFVWITGPLAWYQANEINGEFGTLGLEPPSDVKNLRLLGIISTIFAVVSFLVVIGVVMVMVVGVGVMGLHGVR